MIEPTKKLLPDPSSELVCGLVAPIGADLERLEADLIDQVGLYGDLPSPIRLGALLRHVQLGVTRKVVFKPFMGIGPRRFFDLFVMKLSGSCSMKRKQPVGNKEKRKISGDSVIRTCTPKP